MRLKKERSRVKPKMTQARLAELAGLDQSTVSKIENGHVIDPGAETLKRLAAVLRRYGRKVEAMDLAPTRQPLLVKGVFASRKKGAA